MMQFVSRDVWGWEADRDGQPAARGWRPRETQASSWHQTRGRKTGYPLPPADPAVPPLVRTPPARSSATSRLSVMPHVASTRQARLPLASRSQAFARCCTVHPCRGVTLVAPHTPICLIAGTVPLLNRLDGQVVGKIWISPARTPHAHPFVRPPVRSHARSFARPHTRTPPERTNERTHATHARPLVRPFARPFGPLVCPRARSPAHTSAVRSARLPARS